MLVCFLQYLSDARPNRNWDFFVNASIFQETNLTGYGIQQ